MITRSRFSSACTRLTLMWTSN
ncbi:hypothetical protein AGR7A_Cc10040 [Agrobacterium deltaense NCPPB 1641]|uniref:Uncharacterized protein n=1 Tax=Agrobacterium deltaense NCPPB 1641 TaxID=1183425 RepID=A0A1S7TIC1_9HYPH|nr:hypothetical protein AGR7A_Cc10040 [Agrobacterium deltaense NCPPB 1641]